MCSSDLVMAGERSLPFMLVSVGFLLSLFANMISWSHGVSSVTNQAAKEGNLPRVYAREDSKGRHAGSCIMSGICASALVLAKPLFEYVGVGVFSIALSLDIVFTLAAYIPMFPAFLKLREIDPDRTRPFRVPGGRLAMRLFCWVPVVELVLSIVVACIPLNGSSTELDKIPLLIGVIVVVLLGEIIRHVSHSRAAERARTLGFELPKAKMGPDVDRRRPRRPRRPKPVDKS